MYYINVRYFRDKPLIKFEYILDLMYFYPSYRTFNIITLTNVYSFQGL